MDTTSLMTYVHERLLGEHGDMEFIGVMSVIVFIIAFLVVIIIDIVLRYMGHRQTRKLIKHINNLEKKGYFRHKG